MKFKIGDKVVPLKKSHWNTNLDTSIAWKQAKANNQSYLYITVIKKNNLYLLDSNYPSIGGDYFKESDFIPYNPIPYKRIIKNIIKEK